MQDIEPFAGDIQVRADVDAERMVLRECMNQPGAIGAAQEVLGDGSGHFYRPAHGVMFTALRELFEEGKPTDPITLRAHITHTGRLRSIGSTDQIWEIAGLPAGGSVEHYAHLVRDAADARHLDEAAVRLHLAVELGLPIGELQELAHKLLEPEQRPTERVQQLRSALLDTDGLDSIPEPVPLIDGILFRDSLAWLYGKPGSGKSFVALDWAGSIATGALWHGRGTHSSTVLYLVAEGAAGMRKRVRAWEQHHAQPMHGVRFLPLAVQLLDATELQALLSLVADLRPALLILDTQARITVGAPENDAGEMGRVVAAADALRRASGACVLMVHHSGKTDAGLRGSSAFEGAATSIIKVVKDGGQWVDVTCEKQKDVEDFAPIRLRMTPLGGSLVLTATAADSVAETTDRQNTILEALRQSFGSVGASTSQLLKVTEVAERTFHRELKSLVARGAVVRAGTQARPRYYIAGQEPVT